MAEAYEEKKPDSGQWYVVHTYSGYENKVKVDLEKTIENRQLQDQIFEVSVPTEQVEEIKNGVRKTTDRKLLTTRPGTWSGTRAASRALWAREASRSRFHLKRW